MINSSDRRKFLGFSLASLLGACAPTQKDVRYPSGLRLKTVRNSRLTGKGKEFYDPNKTGNPLVEITKSDLEKNVSDHFKLKEFVVVRDPSIMPSRYTITHKGQTYLRYARLDPEFVDKLEDVRQEAGVPFKINSGYRSNGYNIRHYKKLQKARDRENKRRKKQGKKLKPRIRIIYNSRHTSGDAADIRLRDGHPVRKKLVKEFNGIGDGNSFIHADDRSRKACWGYGRSPNGPEASCLNGNGLYMVDMNAVIRDEGC